MGSALSDALQDDAPGVINRVKQVLTHAKTRVQRTYAWLLTATLKVNLTNLQCIMVYHSGYVCRGLFFTFGTVSLQMRNNVSNHARIQTAEQSTILMSLRCCSQSLTLMVASNNL